MFPESVVVLIPGISAVMVPAFRPVGMAERTSFDRLLHFRAGRRSRFARHGDRLFQAPLSSLLIVATKVPDSSTPSRLTVLKPGSENVTGGSRTQIDDSIGPSRRW
jgi:hypothetical protein